MTSICTCKKFLFLLFQLVCYAGAAADRLITISKKYEEADAKCSKLETQLEILKKKYSDLKHSAERQKSRLIKEKEKEKYIKDALEKFIKSVEYKRRLNDHSSDAYLFGFEVCKDEVRRLFPEVDANLLRIPVLDDIAADPAVDPDDGDDGVEVEERAQDQTAENEEQQD